MSQICPHCNYARQATDAAPDWRCPSCERAYAKAAGNQPQEILGEYDPVSAPENRGGMGKWLLILIVLCAVFWAGRSLMQHGGTPRTMAAVSSEQPEVVLYATSWCGYCQMTRAFFAANGIRYTEQDIEQSSAAYQQHKRLGGNGVPMIVVGDEVIKGWNEQALRQSLGAWIRG